VKPPKVKPYYFSLTIHIVLPESHISAPRNVQKIIKRPRLGNRYTFTDLNYLIQDAARKITAAYPKWEFRMVRLKPDVVRFIYERERAE
jgi:hypothetical protein